MIAGSPPGAHIWVSDTVLYLKEPKILVEMADSGAEKEKAKMGLKHVVSERKEMLTNKQNKMMGTRRTAQNQV